ncbi:Uncharacterised protein (plasmid) [Tsukamurella tyrosinosolvens]|uniref:Uncharacterized protein n=1 Tax=Tsukamurella tyrosinosolvens TaxID=57704 RepID=A0A1H5AZI3_TSUTY|nr:hypothetical protein [Tsukamurella tyrosinosolvens]KXO95211.1 hypothetical protein AXK58_10775 [Tsukamurella tyrosinosolvens]SED47408.1 hypothetical protein SAMN04489793_5046 [Tsukamurella tyrosinosolvens]VEH88850.1 Uncharacterised protein [Tsukamurella tyrosinosolvens]
MTMKITTTPGTGGPVDPMAPPASLDYEPGTMPEHFASKESRDRNARIERQNQDARTAKIAQETNFSAQAAQAQRPPTRPHLKAVASGRVAELWEPIRAREVGAFSRVRSRLDGTREAGQTREAILTAALESGRKREAIPEDLGEQLARVEQRDALTEANRAGLQLAGSMVADRLTRLAQDQKRDLFAAVQADLREVVAQAHQLARALEGITDAETAIRRGESAVIAWGAREGLRERFLTVAASARFVHRACADGFQYVLAGGSPDQLGKAGLDTERISSTWELLDQWIEDLNATDAATDLLVGR